MQGGGSDGKEEKEQGEEDEEKKAPNVPWGRAEADAESDAEEEDDYEDLTSSTTYTHRLLNAGLPADGCQLFPRRQDDEILATAERLVYAQLPPSSCLPSTPRAL